MAIVSALLTSSWLGLSVIDQPLIGPGRKRIMNVTRLMVHGESEVHATLIGIDTDNPDLFSFTPVYVKENVPPFKPTAKP